jgi:polar amino acid transport system permease protein
MSFHPVALLLHGFVDATAHLGLDYRFVLSDYEFAPFLQGALTTVEIALLTILGSVVAGLLLLSMDRSRYRPVALLARGFIELTRNTPTLIQLYCAFLVLNMLITQALQGSGIENPLRPFMWVVLVLSLHKGAFHAEALRAGFDAVPKLTLEGAASLGFDRRTLLWRIQLPLALRFALPALTNNMVELVKASAIASAIAVGDITYASIMIWTQRDNVLELMILILLFFGALTLLVHIAGRWIEQRLRIPGYGHQ